jgi:hypothetical protein
VKWLRWILWSLYYAVQRRPVEFDDYMQQATRTWPPWRKFRPGMWHNDDSGMWHIYFTDEAAYSIPCQQLEVELHIGESGEVVGINIWDACLDAKKELNDGNSH